MTTIVLGDDHQIVRQGIKGLLEDEPDFKVIGEAVNGTEGNRARGKSEAGYPHIRPDDGRT